MAVLDGGTWRARLREPAWLLLPQRMFLGITFAYAGVDKLVDPAFLDPAAPTSIAAQIAAFRGTSPIRPLLGVAAGHPAAVGLLMALGELAVGVGTLLGVRVRLAALGGALISLSLLLTVTWTTRPYYYGSDIVFLVCWLPLLAYGDGGLLSLQRAAERRWAAAPAGGRRAALASLGAAAVAVLATAAAARLGRRSAPAALASGPGPVRGAATTPAPAPALGADVVARAADVPATGVLETTMPDGTAAYLVRLDAGRFAAFDRTCTHAGCQVVATADGTAFACPCHLARYDARTGRVLAGPAPRPLDQIPVRVVGPEVVAGS